LPFWNRKTENWLIVGLGNPGEKYVHNRHNIGFMCVDEFGRAHNISVTRSRVRAKTGEGKIAGKDVILAKPSTFVNLSGEAVGKLVRKHGVKPERLIVVYDELDLPVGRIRLRLGGSSGHNGIKSIVEQIGSEEFIRVRVGIGRPEDVESGKTERREVIDHVLGDFSAEEMAVMEKIIPQVSEALLCLLTDGLTTAMNKFNGTDFRKAPLDK
jgi:PTH1 family peptidyl-tRNA hydrolase